MKTRADVLLVMRGVFESRARARAAIEAGGVFADGRPVAKASELLRDEALWRLSRPTPGSAVVP